ncbi:hypothetical protein Tco_0377489, partial [Tanacetum coccineum]
VSLSSPAVQQLWTLYPGKQTANLFHTGSGQKKTLEGNQRVCRSYRDGREDHRSEVGSELEVLSSEAQETKVTRRWVRNSEDGPTVEKWRL